MLTMVVYGAEFQETIRSVKGEISKGFEVLRPTLLGSARTCKEILRSPRPPLMVSGGGLETLTTFVFRTNIQVILVCSVFIRYNINRVYPQLYMG